MSQPIGHTYLTRISSGFWYRKVDGEHVIEPWHLFGNSFIRYGVHYKERNSSTPDWPVYSNEEPENIVFDTNVTGNAFAEADTWRSEGIRFILDHAFAYKR